MSWDRTCCISATSPSTGSASSSSSFFLLSSSSDYIDEQSTREREPPPPPPSSSSTVYNYHQLYSRTNVSDTCLCNPSYETSTTASSPFIYEQYLTSLKSEQSDHLPYLFDNIIYPQPCSPPSPTNGSITYYQLDQPTNTSSTTYRQKYSSHTSIQPIIYQQLSLIEPATSNIQQKLPIVKRFYYDSNMSNTTTTTIITTTPIHTNVSNSNEHINIPYARLDSAFFGTYDIWQERTIVGRKNNRREVDVNMGSTSVVSRIHFELLLVNGIEFHLKCLSKNGIFINNNYIKMSSTTVLPKQCTLRFPSTDLYITFSSLLSNNNNHHHRISSENHTSQRRSSDLTVQSVPSSSNSQQVILVSVNQESNSNNNNNNDLQSLSINIPNSSPSNDSSFSNGSNSNRPIKSQPENPIEINNNNNSFLGSINLKNEPNEPQPIVNSPTISQNSSNTSDKISQEQENHHIKTGTKPPFSYAQLIVQAILSAPDKQMTLSQIYNFISAQYPYYTANNRGWQNSIRHNLSLNRYFIRLARKDNESNGKGSYWRLDQTCEEKLIDHAYRHRNRRRYSSQNINSITKTESEEISSPITTQYSHDPSDFSFNDNSSTPLSPMTSPLSSSISPIRQTDDFKRKRSIQDDIEDLVNFLINSIENNQTIKRPKI